MSSFHLIWGVLNSPTWANLGSRGSTLREHTARVCVIRRSVAKGSSPSYRQVTSERPSLNEVVFFYVILLPRRECFKFADVGEFGESRFHPLGIHTAGVCVTGRSVAKGSPFATKGSLGVGWHSSFAAKDSLGDRRLRRNSPPEAFVTGHYRAFRSRADDT
ncbi:hypothetical protein Desmer_0099 [Desulfosporosinus meridiei DSM 13257]|uniref:Uncharacterized protein n=1 Tax=Desulfosporosinus meridiei (strain ATCC BAA-275 / DSM 13257 / KCTC 12902 / NCIMB 13706 / S10) TaxID=768704 RepID=J7IKA1_DESMD|nr:hypothetical protein Desmer_0099 [Desulfosporosinus meridiei DSM 13257]